MNRFWDMLEKSTIVSGFIAVGITGSIIYLAIAGLPIPDLLGNSALIIIGFFFGAKSQGTAVRAVQNSRKEGTGNGRE